MLDSHVEAQKLSHAEALKVAESTHEMLSSALQSRGITLPSLSVDAAAYGSKDPNVLIELGRCSIATAEKLIEALTGRHGTGA